MRRFRRIVGWTLAIILLIGGVTYVAFRLSPWPSVWLIRYAFGRGADAASRALEKHLPTDVASRLDVSYDSRDRDAHLDVFSPMTASATDTTLPTIVWIHGGGWVSGTKADVANYLRILAHHGFTTVGIDYSVAPGKQYPTPILQSNAALRYLLAHARELHIDTTRIFLGGDSGGAQIAAELANALGAPADAAALGLTPALRPGQLRGTILYCGPYDSHAVRFDGPFGGFLKTVLWSYLGERDFQRTPQFARIAVTTYVTPAFPATFISAGNGDPLEPQSREFARKLSSLGVRVDSLFFAKEYTPSLPHEYQFNLDIDAGRLALEQSVAFVRRESAD